MAIAQDPIREQLIEARRNQILDAAASVFAEKGFHRTTTKEIAQTAGVSEGTIYNYFDNKADLLIAMVTRLAELESLDEELTEALHGDVRDFLVEVFQHRMRLIQQNDKTMQAVLPEILVNPELRERWYQQFVGRAITPLEHYLRARIESGHMRPINVPLAVRSVQGMFLGLLILRTLGDEPLLSGWDDLPEVLATIIIDGLNSGEGE